jgi:DNA-binding beta-propeller fold protein YncE
MRRSVRARRSHRIAAYWRLDGFAGLALVTALLATAALEAHPNYISTFAGNGVAGLNGDGLPARSTALSLPQDGVWGPDGHFYFLDWNNHRVRRVRDGIVETVVATGELGDGQDGPALEMRLNHPTGLHFDRQGRLLIAAWHNSKVKRVDFTTGMAENVAGTGARAYGGDGEPANLARLDLPSSVVEDPDGNICISDQANFRIRRVDKDGVIETICGTGIAGYTGDGGPASLATLRSPVGQAAPPAGRIDIDSAGRIYIADTGNHVIRRIDTDGAIRTVAGTGQPGYSGDGGPATEAQLNTPSDVAVAPDGTLYIADTMNNRIRRVLPDGRISTIAGTGTQGFSGDGGLGRDAKLNRPYGVAVSADGEMVMIADTHNHRLRILTEEPRESGPDEEEEEIEIIPCTSEVGSVCTYAGTGISAFNGDGKDRQRTYLYWPFDIEFTPSGRVYILDWNNHRVRQVLPDGQVITVVGTDFVGDGPPDLSDQTAPGALGPTVDLNHPTDLQEFPSGELLIMAWHNHKLRQYDPETSRVRVLLGGAVGFAGDGGRAKDALVNQPPRGTLDARGNLFFIDQRNQRIRLIRDFAARREEAIITTVAGTGAPGFNGDGPALERELNFPTGTNPEPSGGLAIDPKGVIYFADSNNHRLRRLQFHGPDFSDGRITTIAGTGVPGNRGDGGPAAAAELSFPQDVEIGPDGKLYFADADNNRVRRIDLESGIIEAVAGTGERGYSGDGGPALQAAFNRPFGIAFDPYGNLYVSDTFNSRIRKVKLTTTPEGPEPILPADYRASFVEVRDCRFSLEHGGVYIRVLTNPESAQAYQDNASTLPVGTVVVKEEFGDARCSDSELLRWRVMRKEAPGFDPVDGDWHWQFLTSRREVIYNDKSTCITCHHEPDCVRRDYMCALPGGAAEMKAIIDGLPATLLSISGTPPDDGHAHGHEVNFDVYAVGADPGDGRGPFILRYDGGDWRRLESGARGDLWWISDRMIDGDFYMCGEDGLILRFTHATQRFERMKTPGGKLLFGVWGTDRRNLWAVGGDLNDEDRGGAIWRLSGSEWVVDATAAKARPEGLPTLYKVWGRAPDDIYAVGRLGTALHFNGVRWIAIPTGVMRPLFTVHGNDTRVVATGGAFQGVILELMGNAFADRTPPRAPQMNGVFISAGGPSAAVGAEGSFALRGPDGWELKEPVRTRAPLDFHAVWMDVSGGVWAVGGDLTIDKAYGVVGYAGTAAIGRSFLSEPCATGPRGAAGTVSYSRDVLPLLRRASCLNSGCHGPSFESDYDLRTYETSFGPGLAARSFGMCNIVPGNPEASFLIEKLRPNPRVGLRMPNGFPPLSEGQIGLIATWIREGAVSDSAPVERAFSRGDIDDDGRHNITDPITLLNHLFLAGARPGCFRAADTNDDGRVGLDDAIFLLNHLFLGGIAPPAPYPACGLDTTADDLGCEASRCP